VLPCTDEQKYIYWQMPPLKTQKCPRGLATAQVHSDASFGVGTRRQVHQQRKSRISGRRQVHQRADGHLLAAAKLRFASIINAADLVFADSSSATQTNPFAMVALVRVADAICAQTLHQHRGQ
jgi:hypothetical protein